MADPEGYIVWYNRRWVEYTGKTLEQMWGRKWVPVLDAEAQPSVLERWLESVATGEPFDMVIPIRGRDGVSRPFLTRVEPVEDDGGRVVRWFGTNTDISELKRAEDALRESERTHRIVADNTYDFEFWRAPDGRYLYVSPSCERVCGLQARPSSWPTRTCWSASFTRRTVPGSRSGRGRPAPPGRASSSSSASSTGTARSAGWPRSASPSSGSGASISACGAATGRSPSVSGRRRRLREADRRKDEFLAMLAHELRNPLAPIRNAVQLSAGRRPPRPTRAGRRDVIERQVQHLARLVDDLLDVSRITRGKIELRKEPLDLAPIVGPGRRGRPAADRGAAARR